MIGSQPPLSSLPTNVSVILPVYGNENTLEELYQQLCQVLDSSGLSAEILFVNDASPDNSLAEISRIAKVDPRVRAISLKRNQGQHRAVMFGFSVVRSGIAVVMDADLQDSPEDIPRLLTKLNEGFAVVFAGRRGRYESSTRLFFSRQFKQILHFLCGLPTDAGMYFAVNQEMMRQLLAFKAPHPYVLGMMACTGLPLSSIPTLRNRRADVRSSFGWGKRFKTGVWALIWVAVWKWRPKALQRDYSDLESSQESIIG